MQPSLKVLPCVLLKRLAGKLLDAAVRHLTEFIVAPRLASDSDHGIVGGKQAVQPQIVESRQELALGEIPGSPRK